MCSWKETKQASIVFGPYILQNPRGKSSNSILIRNKFLHEKQGITWSTSLKASIESEKS